MTREQALAILTLMRFAIRTMTVQEIANNSNMLIDTLRVLHENSEALTREDEDDDLPF